MKRFIFAYAHGTQRYEVEITAATRADAVARLRHQARGAYQREVPVLRGLRGWLHARLTAWAARLAR